MFSGCSLFEEKKVNTDIPNGIYIREFSLDDELSVQYELAVNDDEFTLRVYSKTNDQDEYKLHQNVDGNLKKVSETTYLLKKDYANMCFRNNFIRYDGENLYMFNVDEFRMDVHPEEVDPNKNTKCDDHSVPDADELDAYEYQKEEYKCRKEEVTK